MVDEAERSGAIFQPGRLSPEARERAFRLQQTVKELGGKAAVAKMSGIPASTIGSYMAGVEMKLTNAVKLADSCGITVEWLATGRPPRRRPAEGEAIELEKVTSFREGPHLQAPHRDEISKYSFTPSYQIQNAGYPGFKSPQCVEYFAFDKAWLKGNLRLEPSELVQISVEDDDMAPTISSGDTVLVNVTWQEVRASGIYAMSDGERIVLRRLRRLPNGRALMSVDSKRIPKREIDMVDTFKPVVGGDGETKLFGLVVWTSGTVKGF